MTSSSSRRSTPLPKGWAKIRRRILERDGYTCQIRDAGCSVHATDVDHMGAPDDHRDDMLQAACGRCHQRKTARDARARQASRRRPLEPHPGRVERGAP